MPYTPALDRISEKVSLLFYSGIQSHLAIFLKLLNQLFARNNQLNFLGHIKN